MQINDSGLLIALEIAYLIKFPCQWHQDVAKMLDCFIISVCLYMATTILFLEYKGVCA